MSKSDFVREWIKENPDVPKERMPAILAKQYPDMFASHRHARSVVTNVYNARTGPLCPQVSEANYLTEKQVRRMYDLKTIVMNELKNLPRQDQGGNRIFFPDSEIARRFQGKPGFRSILESDMAKPYRARGSKDTIWGHPDNIAYMRNQGVLI